MGCAQPILPGLAEDDCSQNSVYSPRRGRSNRKAPEIGRPETVKICTVNLGDHVSPFEYYLENHSRCCAQSIIHDNTEEYLLNSCFYKIFTKLYVFSEEDKKIYNQQEDLLFKLHDISKQRYTPLYCQTVGTTQTCFLLEKKEFQQKWKEIFKEIQQNKGKVKIAHFCQDIDAKLFQIFKKYLMKFDLICYFAILIFVYDIKIKQQMSRPQIQNEIAKRIKENRANKYLKYMHEKFKTSLFETEAKVIKLVNFMKKKQLDVIFLQEACEKSLCLLDSYVKDYRYCGLGSETKCAILLNKSFIARFEPKRKHLPLKQLNMRYIRPIQKQIEDAEQEQKQGKKKTNEALMKVLSMSRAIQIEDQKIRAKKRASLLLQLPQVKRQMEKGFGKLPPITRFHKQTPHNVQKVGQRSKTIQEQEYSESDRGLMAEQIISEKFISSFLTSIHLNEDAKVTQHQLLDLQGGGVYQVDTIIQFVGAIVLISIQLNEIKSAKLEKQNQSLIKQNTTDKNYYSTNDKLSKISVNEENNEKKDKTLMGHLKESLKNLKNKFPGYCIIAGAEIQTTKAVRKNEFLDHMQKFRKQFGQQFHFAPNIHEAISNVPYNQRHLVSKKNMKRVIQKKGLYTTLKKKTNFNLNRRGVDVQYMGTDCFIVSTSKIQNSAVYACNGEKIDQSSQFTADKKYLPSASHPFQDFFVYAEITVPVKQIKFVQGKK